MIGFEEQIQRIIALHEGKYWIAMEREALPLLLEMQAEIDRLRNGIVEAVDNVKYYFGERGDAADVLAQLESLQ